MTLYSPDFVIDSSAPLGAPAIPSSEPPYTFRIYPARKLVCLTISGFWNAETIGNFAVDLFEAIGALHCAPGEHTLCCDVSNAAIQAQDIVSAFQRLIAEGPTRARKLALWTNRPLSRMQSRRLMAVRDNIAVFDNAGDARRWLAA